MKEKELRRVLEAHYGIRPLSLRRLQGYETGTFLVKTRDDKLVLKTYPHSDHPLEMLAEESRILSALSQDSKGSFPEIRIAAGNRTAVVTEGILYRLLTYVQGRCLAEEEQNSALLKDFGSFLGSLSSKMSTIAVGSIASRESPWDLQYLLKNHPFVGCVRNTRDRALLEYFFMQFELEVLPRQYELRKAVIHNDANDWNVLCHEQQVVGLIDFGDMCYSWQVNELAVALTYVLMDKKEPLSVARDFICAYHRKFPLQPLEVELLYFLIAGRLCISLCQSARAIMAGGATQTREQAEYIRISEAPARRLLHRWVRINPTDARQVFMDAIGQPVPKTDTAESLGKARSLFFSPALSLSYDVPIAMEKAAMQYMYEASGTTFLDAYNNIMLVGHSHPKVVRAALSTMGRLNTNTRYLFRELSDYAERLLSLFPESLNKVFLVNSGSAATDLALRLARFYTGRRKILALEQGYHGNTSAGIAVSHYKHREGDIHPDAVVGPFPGSEKGNMLAAGSAAEALHGKYLDLIRSEAGTLAGCIAEPIMGCGGQLPLPNGFLSKLYGAIREQGGLCIADEVQIGFGRLGHWTWGFQMQEVVPDIVILGKPMGNGHPIGGVVTTTAIAEAFARGPEFFSSFGGNPVSCAVGKAVLEVLKEEGLQAHARQTGAVLHAELKHLKSLHSSIAEVRGSGLFMGVAFVDDRNVPDGSLAHFISNALKERHILTSTDGPFHNVLKIKPPLPFDTSNVEQLCNEMDSILRNKSPYS